VSNEQTRSYVTYSDSVSGGLLVPARAVGGNIIFYSGVGNVGHGTMQARKSTGGTWGGWFDVYSSTLSYQPGNRLDLRMETDYRTSYTSTGAVYLSPPLQGTAGYTTWSVTTGATDWFKFTSVSNEQTRSYVTYSDTVSGGLLVPARAVGGNIIFYSGVGNVGNNTIQARKDTGSGWGSWTNVYSSTLSYQAGNRLDLRMETDYRTGYTSTGALYLSPSLQGTAGYTTWSVTTGATDWFQFSSVPNEQTRSYVTYSDNVSGGLLVPSRAVGGNIIFYGGVGNVGNNTIQVRKDTGSGWGSWTNVYSSSLSYQEGNRLDLRMETDYRTGYTSTGALYLSPPLQGTAGYTTWSVTTGATDWFQFATRSGAATNTQVIYTDAHAALVVPSRAVGGNIIFYGGVGNMSAGNFLARVNSGSGWGSWTNINSSTLPYQPGYQIDLRLTTGASGGFAHTGALYLSPSLQGTAGYTTWTVNTQ
jgi:hypothetical protein